MSKETIQVQYKYCYLQFIMLSAFMLIMIGFSAFFFDSTDDSVVVVVTWYAIFSILAVVFIILAIAYYQKAELTEEGIFLKSKLFLIKKIYWRDIKRIRIEKLASGTAGVSLIYKEWIVIYTEQDQYRSHGGVNKRNRGPWYVKSSDDNIHTIARFLKRYNAKVDSNFLNL